MKIGKEKCVTNIYCSLIISLLLKFLSSNRSHKTKCYKIYLTYPSIFKWQKNRKNINQAYLRFCEDNSPDVTVNGRTLNVLFRSNKRSKGGSGAKCTASCIDTSAPATTTTAPPATTAAPTTTGLSHNGKEIF